MAVARQAEISRERAQALILAGEVRVDGSVERKAGRKIAPDVARVEVSEPSRYVSRGGVKLESALAEFGWSPAGLHCVDVGASTGGFTDCLLQHGAAAVTAVDVGYGHLAWKLRQDPRVHVVERCNFRYADVHALGGPFPFITVDVSFISLATLAPQIRSASSVDGRVIVLVKPQFEAGRAAVGKGGVVREAAIHEKVLHSVIACFGENGLMARALCFSPIKGPAGNIEFLLGARVGVAACKLDAAGVVRRAHETLA